MQKGYLLHNLVVQASSLHQRRHRSKQGCPHHKNSLQRAGKSNGCTPLRISRARIAHILSAFPLVDPAVKQAALDEFKRMLATGKAATFNPDLAKPAERRQDACTTKSKAIRELIAAGESATVEFKSSARWDVKQNQPGKHVERVIVKTVAAFLNTTGGALVIGVEDIVPAPGRFRNGAYHRAR